MIWFVLLGIIFTVLSGIFAFSWRWDSEIGSSITGAFAVIFGFIALANLWTSTSVPESYERQEVYEMTENGVLRKANTTYYQNENGDFYVQVNEKEHAKRMLFEFFRKPEFEKIDPPVFKNGNLIVDESEDVVRDDAVNDNIAENNINRPNYCVNCGNGLNEGDKFCSDCGIEINSPKD